MKILCPTDFSAHAQVALEYAMHLANALDAEVHILSVFQVRKSSASFVYMDDLIRKATVEDMDKLMAGLGPLITEDNLPIATVQRGATVDTILDYSIRHHIDLVVMGTQGGNSLRTTLFGSTTRAVAKKTTIPLLAIPESAPYKLTSSKLLLALDDKAIDNESIFAVPLKIGTALDLSIDILHVQQKEQVIPFDPSISIFLQDTLGDVHLKTGTDPVLVIKAFAERENVGILLMIRRDKSFLEALLTVGDTSAELTKTKVPLMILPEMS